MAYARTHIVLFSYHAWGMNIDSLPRCISNLELIQIAGRVRPLVNLAARLVKLCSVEVTVLVTNSLYERTQAELARSFEPGEDDVMEHVR